MVYKVVNAPLALSVFRYCEFANFFLNFQIKNPHKYNFNKVKQWEYSNKGYARN